MGYKSKKRLPNKKAHKKNSKKKGGFNSTDSFSEVSQGSLHLSDLQGPPDLQGEPNFGDDIESIPMAENEPFHLDAVSSIGTSVQSFPSVSSSLTNSLDQNADFSDYSPIRLSPSITNSMGDAEDKTDSERSSFMNGGKRRKSRKNKKSKKNRKSRKSRKIRK